MGARVVQERVFKFHPLLSSKKDSSNFLPSKNVQLNLSGGLETGVGIQKTGERPMKSMATYIF